MLSHKRTAGKIKRTYGFEPRKNDVVFETIIKVNFHGINGFTRKRIFIKSKNPKLQKFFKNYDYFKQYATTFEALSFFIEILLKHPGKVFVNSTFFENKFILESKIGKDSRKLEIKMFVINSFLKKDQINFKINKEEEILKELEKIKKVR